MLFSLALAMKTKAMVVLLHGAGLGSFIWRDVLPGLTLNALAIDFPNRAFPERNKKLTLQDYVDHCEHAIAAQQHSGKLILVSHSISSIVAASLCRIYGSKIAAFISFSGAIPKRGHPYLSIFPVLQRLLMRTIFTLAGTKPPDSQIREMASDLSDRQMKEVVANFAPEATRLFTDSFEPGAFPAESIYVKSTRDKIFTIPLQEKMIEIMKPSEVVSIHAGHLPMMRSPKEAAHIINMVSERIS